MSESQRSNETAVPEPREGLWYCEITDYEAGGTIFGAVHQDSLGILPSRNATWAVAHLPESMQDGIEVGRRFWWDRTASLENLEDSKGISVMGYYPAQPITDEQRAYAQAMARETIKLIEAQDT